MKDRILTYQEWQHSRSTYAVNPGAEAMIRGMYQDYVNKKLEQQQQEVDDFYCLEEEDKTKCKTQCPFCDRV